MSVKKYIPRPVQHEAFAAIQFDGTPARAAEIIAWVGDDPGGFPYAKIGQPTKGDLVGLFIFVERDPREVMPSSYVVRPDPRRGPQVVGWDKFEAQFVEVPDDPDVTG